MPPSKLEQRGRRHAARANLIYVNAFDRGYSRRRCGRGFTYLSTRGKTIRSSRTRSRIEALAIPPSWEDVWICPRANGHIQAIGRDEAGRRQYIYHERWRAISEARKFDRLSLIADVLPRLRRRIRRDLNRRGLPRERVLAAVARLIDKGGLRVGSTLYTTRHGSHGATTLLDEHVQLDGTRVSLEFPGKGGVQREIEFADEKLAAVIRQCEEIDGQFLFGYEDDDGIDRSVDSGDVNRYLNAIAGQPLTAKDFRTWWASVVALESLVAEPLPDGAAQRRNHARRAVDAAASYLGNTRAVCRSSYIHPSLLAAAESGELATLLAAAGTPRAERELSRGEAALKALLPHL